MADTVFELRDGKGKVVATDIATSPAQAVALKWRGYTVQETPAEEAEHVPPGRVSKTPSSNA